jgi:hypothetical protein
MLILLLQAIFTSKHHMPIAYLSHWCFQISSREKFCADISNDKAIMVVLLEKEILLDGRNPMRLKARRKH